MSGTSVRTRKNVWTLSGKNDDLFWYGRAIAAMQARPITDPTSWRYMAAVHGYPGHTNDPLAKRGEALPSAADQRTFWNQCQHHSWYFLPWHRGYLAVFEEIVADAVVQLSGPEGWALPYWNYSFEDPNPVSPSSDPNIARFRSIPSAFLDGESPLFSPSRTLTTPSDELSSQDVSLACLIHFPFAGAMVGNGGGFGGPKTGFNHQAGSEGWVEIAPHDLVHGDVGGDAGFMNDPNTAALDPIFWLHHANIDRLWEVWRGRNPRFKNPTDSAWLNESFVLHDKKRNLVRFTPAQMLDTTKVRHGYNYDDVSDPLPRQFAPPSPAMAAIAEAQPPALVGASATNVAITAPSTTVRIAFQNADQKAATDRLRGLRLPRVILNLENITATGRSGNLAVSVNAPGAVGQPIMAGHISMFGVPDASQPSSAHGGSGVTKFLEITHQVEQLQRDSGWDGKGLDVTFAPSRPGQAVAVAPGLKIGRLSVYYC